MVSVTLEMVSFLKAGNVIFKASHITFAVD